MKAIILNQPKDFSIKEIDKPQIKDDEVLIRVKASGICTNDVRDFNGDCNYSYPRIGGHEYGGVIEEIGAAVNKAHFKKGDKVVPYIIDDCKECYYCKHGDENICEHHAHSHIFHNPEGLSGYGGFGEFVVAKADDLFVYAKDTPFEKMAFTEPVACVINSINRTDIKFGDDVVVIGGGTMGLLHVMLLRQRGARVILSEPLAERREKALSLGCSNVIDPMAGDAGESARFMSVNILKVGHHGSKGASSEEFLSYVKPENALISCGAGNSYGHPHTETLQRLSGIGAKVYRTDESGEIAVRVRDGSYKIEAFKALKG